MILVEEVPLPGDTIWPCHGPVEDLIIAVIRTVHGVD